MPNNHSKIRRNRIIVVLFSILVLSQIILALYKVSLLLTITSGILTGMSLFLSVLQVNPKFLDEIFPRTLQLPQVSPLWSRLFLIGACSLLLLSLILNVLLITSYQPAEKTPQENVTSTPKRSVTPTPVILLLYQGTSIPVEIGIEIHIKQCEPYGQELCYAPLFKRTESILTGSRLMIEFVNTNCSLLRLHVFIDGKAIGVTPFLKWPSTSLGPVPQEYISYPLDTGILDLGRVTPNKHILTLEAEGKESGCNQGHLDSWDGTLSSRNRSCGQSSLPQRQ